MHSEENNRKLALLALKASDEKNDSCCPSDEIFSAYIDDVLNGEMKRQVTVHLNHCADCREHWQEISGVTHDVEVEIARNKQNGAPASIIERIKAIVDDWFIRVSVPATAALSLALVVTLTLVDTDATPLGSKLDDQYSQLNSQLSSQPLQGEGIPMPWENAAMAFNSSAPMVAQRALGAGLWQGEADLGIKPTTNKENPFPAAEVCCWEQTQWDGYYYLGRWLGLMWWQTHLLVAEGGGSVLGSVDWTHNREILQSLQGKLAAISDADRIPNTTAELDKLMQQMASPIDAIKLNRQVLNTIHRLGPTTYE